MGIKREGKEMGYPKSYHDAIRHLVSFGGHGGDTKHGRMLCARALLAVRSKCGTDRAIIERRHMLFISGQFPVKAKR